ncbi:MAG: hypothetical protein WCG94_01810 [Methanothrix sp.]
MSCVAATLVRHSARTRPDYVTAAQQDEKTLRRGGDRRGYEIGCELWSMAEWRIAPFGNVNDFKAARLRRDIGHNPVIVFLFSKQHPSTSIPEAKLKNRFVDAAFYAASLIVGRFCLFQPFQVI